MSTLLESSPGQFGCARLHNTIRRVREPLTPLDKNTIEAQKEKWASSL
ncbi:MAG: hypothetical protein ABI781_08675 [Burkholderiales bacterium]